MAFISRANGDVLIGHVRVGQHAGREPVTKAAMFTVRSKSCLECRRRHSL